MTAIDKDEALLIERHRLDVALIKWELTTAVAMAGVVETAIRANHLPHAREALTQARRAHEEAATALSGMTLGEAEAAALDEQRRESRPSCPSCWT